MAALALRDIFKRFNITISDFVIVLAVLLSAVILAVSFGKGGGARECIIKIDGEEYARYELATIDKEKTVEIKNQYGENTVVIDRNGAYVSYSSCADKSEVKAGRISKSGESLICLPHRLEVYLTGGELDGTSW